jgi:hypothetical protein
MAKFLLLCSLTLVLVLSGSAAFAAPPAADPPFFVVEQAETAPDSAPQCVAEAPVFEIKPKMAVSICQGNACTKTSDCRPAGVAECANCWCLGPAGDKSCGCF